MYVFITERVCELYLYDMFDISLGTPKKSNKSRVDFLRRVLYIIGLTLTVVLH